MISPPCLHVTIRTGTGADGKARRIEIPQADADQHHFPKGTKIVIALESDPMITIPAVVAGNKRRFATIFRKRENSNRFLIGTDVRVMLDSAPAKRDCAKCIHASTPAGKQCYTLTRRLKELVTDAGKPFYPEFVIPAMDRIVEECKRYKEVV